MLHPRTRVLVALACLCAALRIPAQTAPDGTGQERQGYLVVFAERPFDLRAFRAAVLERQSHAELSRIVSALEDAARRDQEGFARSVAELGGRVTAHWWIVNGCAIEIPEAAVAAVRRLPNVASVEADEVRRPHLAEATDGTHHASDQANAMKDGRGKPVLGTGVAVAVLDAGTDSISGTSNRPHRSFYPGGDPGNNQHAGIGGSLLLAAVKVAQSPSVEDTTGHGSAVIGCASANQWNSLPGVDAGIAPGAGTVSVNITNAAGLTVDSWMISAWQTVASLRQQHGIGVGNNSFSGSPSLTNALQQALDSTAYHADMLICVSAGNAGSDTKESQHCFNGLAVGSVDKKFLSRSQSSAVGPLFGTGRTYPDITAVGNGIVTVLPDQEAGKTQVSGTSFAAPLVAGAAALLRQAQPALTATQVKALLLDTSLFRSSDRNQYGIGFMRADLAVTAALANGVAQGTVTADAPVARFTFTAQASQTATVTVAWMRTNFAQTATPDLDLRVYDAGNQLVGQDLNPANSYEHVRFSALANATYLAEVTWANAAATSDPVSFAIAGATNRAAPAFGAIKPASFPSQQPTVLELAGTGLAAVRAVDMSGVAVTTFQVMDDTRLRLLPPPGLPIGAVKLTVSGPFGSSAPGTVHATGLAVPVLFGPGIVLRGATLFEYRVLSDRGWLTLLLASPSDKPSVLPGIFDLGIGNGFTELVPLLYLAQDAAGASKVAFAFPTSIPPATIVHLQALTADPNAPRQPFPRTNVQTVQIF